MTSTEKCGKRPPAVRGLALAVVSCKSNFAIEKCTMLAWNVPSRTDKFVLKPRNLPLALSSFDGLHFQPGGLLSCSLWPSMLGHYIMRRLNASG